MTEYAVSIENVSKTYRGGSTSEVKHALNNVTINVPRGSFFGLLGPNGAGKSTLINIMAGLTLKTSGKVTINGYDQDKDERMSRLSIGVVPQELVLDTFFTVREALDIHAGYYGVPKKERRTDEIIAAMGLTDKANVKSRQLSGGMRRRLLIAKALVHTPPVLILDEPTAGVDVELRTQLWDYVRALNKSGTTVLLTTHYLEEAEELCDEIAIIHQGEVRARDTKENLMHGLDSKALILRFEQPILEVPPNLKAEGTSMRDGKLVIQYQPSKVAFLDIIRQVEKAGLTISDLSTEEADLEDVFRTLTRTQSAA